MMADELIARLDLVKRKFERALIIGNDGGGMTSALEQRGLSVIMADPGFGGAKTGNGVQSDEDRLPFADASFDVVIAIGTLDSVNDLPGALMLIRRILVPDGLFLGAMVGAGSLNTLKSVLLEASQDEQFIARYHPQIDVRAAGDLLVRAGFQLPVADCQTVIARYSGLFTLFADLRANAMTNALITRFALRRDYVAEVATLFAARSDVKTEEIFMLLFLVGWAPAMLKPARSID